MLGHPVAGVTGRFGDLRQRGGLVERLPDAAAFDDGDEIENGDFQRPVAFAGAGWGVAMVPPNCAR